MQSRSSALVSRQSSPTPAKRAAGSRPTILLVVWPEYGHVVTPLALAKQLSSAGYRVVFAGVRTFEQPMRKLGYEYASLSEPRADGAPTLFDFLPDHAQFCAALDVFVEVFRTALAAHRPSLILFDSLYSAFGIIASDAGVAWAIYETDLPREYDPGVPPPHLMLEPGPETAEGIQAEWDAHLERSYAYLAYADSRPDLGRAWATAYFPRILTRALQERFGTTVPFEMNVLYAPVAKVPRMVFCPEAFDFERVDRTGTHWVGPCIDSERREPDFPWDSLPANMRIAYCALGTQSARQPNAVKALRTVVEVFSARDDYFLVLVCNRHQKNELPRAGSSVMLVERAPQLALLRRASVAWMSRIVSTPPGTACGGCSPRC